MNQPIPEVTENDVGTGIIHPFQKDKIHTLMYILVLSVKAQDARARPAVLRVEWAIQGNLAGAPFSPQAYGPQ